MTMDSLRELNPLPLGDQSLVDEQRRDADLRAILASPQMVPSRRIGGRTVRRVAWAGVVAAGLAIALVVGLPLLGKNGTTAAYAATPPVLSGVLTQGDPAAPDLIAAADLAAKSTDPGSLGSQYSTWSLFTRVAGGEPIRTAVVPQEVQRVVNADGTGRLLVRSGAAEVPAGTDASSLDLPASGSVVRDDAYGPGQMPLMYPGRLSADQGQLRLQLTAAHPVDQLGTGELFVAISDLYKEQRPAALVRAQLLQLLADRPDVMSIGSIQDRAGRTGLGLAVDASQPGGLPARFVLVVDEHSGQILSFEQTLTSSPGKLDVKIPAVIEYALFR